MRTLLRTVVDGFYEDLGYPARLLNLLSTYPQIRVSLEGVPPCIGVHSVPAWHELGTYSALEWPRRKPGTLMGWRSEAGSHWQSFQIERNEYTRLVLKEVTPDWSCDIADIDGFAASKSELSMFTSTDQMVEANSRELINEVSLSKLEQNLAHREIRILHSPDTTVDHFTRYLWDGRLWLINEGGSHHTAASKFIATRLRHPVKLTGRLRTYSLNAVAIASLRRDYAIFVINDEVEIANAFFDAMRSFKATWLWHRMPRPYEHARAVLLPKSERRSMRVAAELAKAGVVDLGAHLAAQAAR